MKWRPRGREREPDVIRYLRTKMVKKQRGISKGLNNHLPDIPSNKALVD